MLMELRVSNFAVIDQLSIHFGSGLNVLSGETGAGKSVLLKSLSLLMGVKGSLDFVRSPKAVAQVEGVFDLSKRQDLIEKLREWGLECEDSVLIVRRTLSEDKSRIYINGGSCTLNQLREIVSPLVEVSGQFAPLIEMTGQHDNRHLLSPTYHLEMVDLAGGLWADRSDLKRKYKLWRQTQKEIEELQKQKSDREQRLDYLNHQLVEIKKIDPQPGELEQIEKQMSELKQSVRLQQFAEKIEGLFYNEDEPVLQKIKIAQQWAREIPQVQDKTQLDQAYTLLEDFLFEVGKMGRGFESSAESLEALEARYSDLKKLVKKHGPGLNEVLLFKDQIQNEIQDLETLDSTLGERQKQEIVLRKEFESLARSLHKKRSVAAKNLELAVNQQLMDLNMKGSKFIVFIDELPSSDATNTGVTDCEFRLQAQGEALPIARAASGGELSRILLALKSIVGAGPYPRTFLFDEVDAGVSGPTAEKVGKKLKKLGEGQQVICVSHLPQVAACADQHFLIQKEAKKQQISSTVVLLTGEGRIKELARLISGEKITQTSLDHATQLIRMSEVI